jgi:hypothetical protein
MHNIFELASMAYPHLLNQIVHIESMPLGTRSTLIKCSQAQSFPVDTSSPLYMMVKKLPPYILRRGHRSVEQPLKTFHDLRPLLEGPVTSCILLDLCRSLPLPIEEVEEARLNSWKKEGIKIEEPSRECIINWNPIFDSSCFNEPMVPFLPPNPTMNRFIFAGLLRWRNKFKSSLLFPRYTRKNMSRATRREFERETGMSLENTPIFSQEDYLRLYHRSGICLQGETEMRQKWYPSGAKPRTYFAQGGEHYSQSMHLQDLFSELVNCIPTTNHITRLQPTRLTLREGEHYRVYDLTTFTSNMAEQRGFVLRLAEFCMGIQVYRFDVFHGIQECDLGDLLYRYYDACVSFPSVSYERVPGVFLDAAESYLTTHQVASMLGIFGNLMTCTFAHGALMLQLVENEDEVNIAGDDGIVKESYETEDQISLAIGVLGDCEMTKTFRSDVEGCICLKRPLYHSIGGLEQGIACIPPSLVTFAHYCFDISDPRYTFHGNSTKTASEVSIVGKDLMRFLRSVYRWGWRLDDIQISYALLVAESWSRLVFRDPSYPGRLPHSGDSFFWPSCVSLEEFRTYDPLDSLLLRRYAGVATLPIMEDLQEEPVDLMSLEVGDIVRCNSSRELSMATMLGYLERETSTRTVYGIDGYNYIKRLLTSYDPIVYTFRVVKTIPHIFN